MASGSFEGSNAGFTLRNNWSSSTNIASNSSTVTIDHYLVISGSLYIGNRSNTCVCEEAKEYSSPSISTAYPTTVYLGQTTHTVKHNDNGTKTVVINDTFNLQATIDGNYVSSVTASTTIILDTIPRASQPSCITYPETTEDVGNLGSTILIHMNRKSSEFTHTVKYTFGSKSQTIKTNVKDNVEWTIPKTLASELPSQISGKGKITVDTYQGTKKIGTKEVEFMVTIPDTEEFYPSVTNVELTETENSAKEFGFFIQNVSKIAGKITAIGAYNSTITNYSIKIDGQSFNNASFTTNVISTSNPKIKIEVTDSRGRKKVYEEIIEVMEYNTPAITNFAAYRNSLDQSKIKLSFSCNIYSLENKNSYSFNFYYKKITEENYIKYEIDLSKISLADAKGITICSFDADIIPADVDTSYDVYLEVKDKFKTVPSKYEFVSTLFRLLNITADKKFFAIGKLHEKEGFIENAIPEIFYENLYRSEGDYNGIVLSCPSIIDGKINLNIENNCLEFSTEDGDFSIPLMKKSKEVD